jgi:hypothetical protein
MGGPARRRRRHAAASSRILAAGLSSAAALGMVAGMGADARSGRAGSEPERAAPLLPAPAPLLRTAPARPAPPARSARPVTRTRSS